MSLEYLKSSGAQLEQVVVRNDLVLLDVVITEGCETSLLYLGMSVEVVLKDCPHLRAH